MRLWSLHPQYLDAKGLVALWRETLLAHHVLSGKTKGYKNHPQLNRFKDQKDPIVFLNSYLEIIALEADSRGYVFDKAKIPNGRTKKKITVTTGQMSYEREHLLKKLERRDPKRHAEYKNKKKLDPHPLFEVVKGEVADWEKQ